MTANVARETTVQEIPLEKLDVHRLNPRKDAGDVAELAASIRTSGVLEPLIAVKDNGGYAVVAGSRRLAAAKVAGLKTVPVLVREMTDADVAAATLIENIQREDLSPLDEARAYREWLQLTGKAQKELAERVGKHPSTIANALRLLEAPVPVQKALEDGAITAAHARVALSLPAKALPLLDLRPGQSVKQLEEQARTAQRSVSAYEQLKAAVEKARAAGKTVTWHGEDRNVWLGGGEFSLEAMFGKAPARIAGRLVRGGSGYYGDVSTETHAKFCDCEAVQIDASAGLSPVCISPTGWKKAVASAKSERAPASRGAKKKVQSKAAKEAREREVLRRSIKAAETVLAGKALNTYHGLQTPAEPKFLQGGLTGEPARLALWALLAKYSSTSGPLWKTELWKKIASTPLATVRERLTGYLIGLAMREIKDASPYNDKYHNTRKIRELVNAHYAPAKKAAKR